MTHDNSNRGALNYTREKRSERSPDFYGRLQISGDVLAALNEGKPIRLSGWRREGRYGEFISLAAEVERPQMQMLGSRQGASEAGTARPYNMGEAEAREKAALGARSVPSAASNVQAALDAPFDDDIPF